MLKQLNINDLETIKKINDFLKSSNYSEYNQSIEWNLIRNEQKKYYLYYLIGNKIIWVCNLLEKEENGQKYLYAPRGPVLDYDNPIVLDSFFKEIKKWMYNKNYNKIVINPCIKQKLLKNFPDYVHYYIKNRHDYNKLLDSCKLAIMNIIYDEEKLIKKLSSKTRQNIRRSYKKDLKFKISNIVDLEDFYKLYTETSERHKFNKHSYNYFKKIISIYKDKIIFLEVWKDNLPLAMSIDIIYNNKLIYLYGVSSSSNRNLLGMYHLQWEAIKYCINNRIPQYDFGGVFCEKDDKESKDYGLYTFKRGFCYDDFIDIISDIIIKI